MDNITVIKFTYASDLEKIFEYNCLRNNYFSLCVK